MGNGCRASLGQEYCAPLHKCIRPWEEKCEAPKVLQAGGDLDAHGCKASTGEQYCEATKKCIRPWEEKCEELGCSDCLDREAWREHLLSDVRHDGLDCRLDCRLIGLAST